MGRVIAGAGAGDNERSAWSVSLAKGEENVDFEGAEGEAWAGVDGLELEGASAHGSASIVAVDAERRGRMQSDGNESRPETMEMTVM